MNDDFDEKIKAICAEIGIHEFALYGRYPRTVNADGHLCPPVRTVWVNSEDPLVAQEAAYHLGRIAVGKEP